MLRLATPHTRAQRAAKARGGHSHLGMVLGALAGLAVVLALLAVFVMPRILNPAATTQDELPNQGSQVEVSIPDGSGANAIASALKGAGVVADSQAFLTTVQQQKADSTLKSGAYTFTVGMSIEDIIARLQSGPNSTASQLVIPEGLTVAQTASIVQGALGISSDDFVAQAKASNYAGDYPFLQGVSDDSLEGFLCPKTYNFSGQANVSADTVIRAMLTQYGKDVATLDFSGGRDLIKQRYGIDVSDYDIIKLASIVEREAVTEGQRANVSSTFFNRLKAGMALQSDATMMYVTGGEVTADDLKQESPYNTYLNKGLTPTPICAPSIESIKATLAPNDTNYLYFYITQTDEWFSATYDEHLQAIEADKTAQTQG